MPNQLFNHLESGLINHIFMQNAWPMPSSMYLALCSTPPTNLSFTELSISNYARQNIGLGASNWFFPYSAQSGLVSNKNEIDFPTPAAYWGWVSGAVLIDQVLGYTQFFTVVVPAVEVRQGVPFFIPASGMTVRMS